MKQGLFSTYRSYLLLLASKLTSNVGTVLTSLAIVLIATDENSGDYLLSSSMIARALPAIILGPVAGYLIRRMNQKHVVMLCEGMKGVLVFILFLYPQPFMIVPVGLFVVLFSVFSAPAMGTLEFQFLGKENYVTGRSYNRALQKTIKVFTPLVASAILLQFDVQVLFLVDAVSYVLAVALIGMVHVESGGPQDVKKKKHQILESLKDIKNSLIERNLVFFFFLSFLGSATFISTIIYVRKVLHFDASQYSVLISVGTVGTVLSSLLLGWLNKKSDLKKQFAVSCVFFALVKAGFIFGTEFLFIAILYFFNASFSNWLEIVFSGILVSSAKKEDRPLVIANANSLQNLGNLLGYTLAPLLAVVISYQSVIVLSGVAMIVAYMVYDYTKIKSGFDSYVKSRA